MFRYLDVNYWRNVGISEKIIWKFTCRWNASCIFCITTHKLLRITLYYWEIP